MISDPPAIVENETMTPALKQDGIPFLKESDPILIQTYRWLLSKSTLMKDLVEELAKAEPKACYMLAVTHENKYQIRVSERGDGYRVTLLVPVTYWAHCGDALEPWVAGTVFLMHAIAAKGHWRLIQRPDYYSFMQNDIDRSFAFQRKIREEIVPMDPVRLVDLPNGEALYRDAFRRKRLKTSPMPRIPLPR